MRKSPMLLLVAELCSSILFLGCPVKTAMADEAPSPTRTPQSAPVVEFYVDETGVSRSQTSDWRAPVAGVGFSNTIRAIDGYGNDVWAVGEGGTILQWRNEKWEVIASLKSMDFYDVRAFASNEIYICGDKGAILKLEGGSWRQIPSGTKENLRRFDGDNYNAVTVSSEGRIEAYLEGGQRHELPDDRREMPYRRKTDSAGQEWTLGWNSLYRTNGRDVEKFPIPQCDHVTDFAVANPSLVWVIGERQNRDQAIYRHDGSGWERSVVSSLLRRLLVISSEKAFAVGDSGSLYKFLATSGWAKVPLGTTENLLDVFCQGERIWVVGERGSSWYFDGSIWKDVGSSRITQGDIELIEAVSSTDIWMVATNKLESAFHLRNQQYQGQELLHFDGSRVMNVTAPNANRLRDLKAFSNNDVWAVGYRKSVQRWNGREWATLLQGTDDSYSFSSISGNSSSDIWIGGNSEEILHYDGNNVITTSLPGVEIFDIEAMPPNQVWVSAVKARLPADPSTAPLRRAMFLYFNGESWEEFEQPRGGPAFSIAIRSQTDIYACTRSLIYKFDGTGWSIIYEPLLENQFKSIVAPPNSNELWVALEEIPQVNDTGGLLHFDGQVWNRVNLPVNLPILDLSFTPQGSGFLVGKAGTFLFKN